MAVADVQCPVRFWAVGLAAGSIQAATFVVGHERQGLGDSVILVEPGVQIHELAAAAAKRPRRQVVWCIFQHRLADRTLDAHVASSLLRAQALGEPIADAVDRDAFLLARVAIAHGDRL